MWKILTTYYLTRIGALIHMTQDIVEQPKLLLETSAAGLTTIATGDDGLKEDTQILERLLCR